MYAMKNLENMKMLASHAPEAMTAFVAFDKAALAGGALSAKVKELMAIAVALTTQCPYCIELHSIKARESGATESEIAETVLVAAALRAGGAITHGTHACIPDGCDDNGVDRGGTPPGALVRQTR